jgi:hypothetical protein
LNTASTSADRTLRPLDEAWAKLLGACRLYAEGHRGLQEFEAKFHQALRAVLATSGGVLACKVTPVGVMVEGTLLLEATNARESLTRPLFLEGIQAIRFSTEANAEEAGRFIRMWDRALLRQLPPEQTLASWCWEAGFAGIEVVAVESLANLSPSEAAELARLDERASELAQRAMGAPVVPPRPAAPTPTVQLAAMVGVEPDEAEDAVGHPGVAALSPHELTALRNEYRRVLPDGLERGVPMILRLLPWATPAETTQATQWISGILEQVATRKDPMALPRVLRQLAQMCTAAGPTQPHARALMDILLTQDGPVLRQLMDAVGDGAQRPLLERVVAEVPAELLHLWTGLLLKLDPGPQRTRMAGVLVKRQVPASLLVALLPRCTAQDLGWLALFRVVPAVWGPLSAALRQHPSAEVRLHALQALEPWELAGAAGELTSLLAAPEAGVRQAALQLVVAGRVGGAAPAVAQSLLAHPPHAEAVLLMQTLADLKATQVAGDLVTYVESEKSPELREQAVLRLGVIGDATCLPHLRRWGRGWFAPRRIKDACRAAVVAIEQRGGNA